MSLAPTSLLLIHLAREWRREWAPEFQTLCASRPRKLVVLVHLAEECIARLDARPEAFRKKCFDNLALDGGDNLSYIAPTMVNLQLSEERYPDIQFRKTREH